MGRGLGPSSRVVCRQVPAPDGVPPVSSAAPPAAVPLSAAARRRRDLNAEAEELAARLAPSALELERRDATVNELARHLQASEG